jgi:putative flippase GtrA
MKVLRDEFFSTQFARFVVVGGFAALVNFLSRIAFSHFINYPAAIVAAYCIGIVTAYLLSRLFVFGASEKGPFREVTWFVGVNILGVLQTLAVSVALAWYVLPWLGVQQYREEVAHFVGVCVPVFTSYLGHKYLTFK